METLITSGVEVRVETTFQPEHSNVTENEYFFAYQITLFNHNPFTVQLISRRWKITDTNFEIRHIEGEGVVGRQPVLYTADTFQYVSGCSLQTPIGKMEGVYLFENKQNGEVFEVTIPAFKLIAPVILN